jgi:hypothetical protein
MSSETLVNFYQTTRRYNPEGSHLLTHRRENLKSYLTFSLFTSNRRGLKALISDASSRMFRFTNAATIRQLSEGLVNG